MTKVYKFLNNQSGIRSHDARWVILTALIVVGGFLPQNLSATTKATFSISAFQGVPVSGTVTDEAKAPLPGVNIIEKGTVNGTVTDSEGKFKLTVGSTESVLIISFVGTITQQITVGNRATIDVQLVTDAATLSEVVVVGYGTQEKRDVTGSVASVKSEDFNRGIINSPEQLLQGKVAGVNVTSASGEPGGLQAITIRGPGGVRTGSAPLFVVDGLPLDNSTTGGATNPLNFLNPQDIESIDVLKDASATAIYGSRGANGVILITTKKGKSGVATLNYSTSFGISKLARPIPVFSADEYRLQVPAVGGVLEDSLASTNWQDEITRTALTQNHNITLGGGSENLSYFASLGLQDQEGIIKNNDLKRYTGRINISQKFLDDRLHVDLNLNASQTLNNRPPSEGNNGASISIIGSAISTNPTYPAYDANGNPYQYNSGVNPLRSLELTKDVTTTNRVMGNISPSFRIMKGLVYRLNFGIDNSNAVQDLQSLPSLIPQQDGRLESIYTSNRNNLIENYLTYNYDNADHSFTILGGHSYQKIQYQRRSFSINKFPISEIEPIYNPGQGQDLSLANNRPGGEAFINELQSFFGRVTYAFKDRYLLTATIRADGSSKFGANNKYGTFPSFSLGWRISEEGFMQSLPISNLKLRLGWGLTGNQEIPPKITRALFTSQVTGGTSYPLDPSGTYPAGTTYSRLANPDLKWEVSSQTNVGLDFGFLTGALTGSVDVFNKVSNDILLQVFPADPVQPANTTWTNVKDMTITNKGLELSLGYQSRGANGFSYNVGGNATFIRNIVENSPYSVIQSGAASGSGLTSATINGYINGEPIGTFFLKEHTGFDELGLSTFRDVDGDGLVTDKDRVALGSSLPTTMYNFYGSLAIKGFDLTFNFNGVAGNKVYDNTANSNFYKLKLSKGVNTTAEATAFPEESVSNAAPVSSRFLKDGAFLRLNNLTLGYTFSPAALGLQNWVSSLRLSVTGQNLLLSTKYDGYDPEVNTDRTIDGISSYGIDYLSYPKARSVVFGLNVSF
jgi:TonB-linked SusC/RagA family outer membrane protein